MNEVCADALSLEDLIRTTPLSRSALRYCLKLLLSFGVTGVNIPLVEYWVSKNKHFYLANSMF